MVSKRTEEDLGKKIRFMMNIDKLPFHVFYCTPGDLVKKLQVHPSYKFYLTEIQEIIGC